MTDSDSVARTGTAPGEDLSALAWVHGELRRALETAHKALRRYLKEADALGGAEVDAVDPAVLRSARNQLHQGVGALELVGLPAVADVLRASEMAVQRMVAKPALVHAKAVDTVEQVSFALLDYLSRQLAGKPVSPVALFPQYQAALQIAGADRVHPADLWKIDWQWRELPADAGATPRRPDDETRNEMETLVLALMRHAGPDAPSAALARMSELCADLGAGARQQAGAAQLATFWQLAAAVFEAQAAGLLASDVFTKRIASRLLAQLRLNMRGERALSDRLAQDLLFFCSHAQAPSAPQPVPRLDAVRRTWGLSEKPTADYTVPRLGRFDPALLALAKKRVAVAKDSWSAVAGGEQHRMTGLGDQFSLVGDSLQRLFPSGDVLARALQTAVVQTVASGEAPPPELAMEVATGILYLDASLEDGELDQPELAERVQRLARRIDEVRIGADPQPLDTWMEELYRRVSDRQTMGSVVQELRASLSEIEKQIDQYFRNPAERQLLIPVPAQLSAMRGVLSVLGLDQASQAVLHMRDDVDALAQTEVDPHQAIQAGTFDRLADNLGALSFLIDMISVQPQLAKSLFRFDPETGNLSAVMGQSERVSAFAALDEAAAPVQGPAAVLDTGPALAPAAAPRPEATLMEQVLALAEDAARPETAEATLQSQVERVAQAALAAEQQEVARRLGLAAAALREGPAQRPMAQAELAEALMLLAGAAPEAPPPATPVPAPAPVPEGGTGLEGDAEMREIFIEEAREVVADAAAALERLADTPDSAADMTAVRRAFHTLKGSSRMVGLREYGEAAWACEQLYNARLASAPRVDATMRTFTGEALHYLGDWAEAIAEGLDRGHNPAAVAKAADTLRLHGHRLPIEAPAPALLPAGQPVDTSLPAALLGVELDFGPEPLPQTDVAQAPSPAVVPEPETASQTGAAAAAEAAPDPLLQHLLEAMAAQEPPRAAELPMLELPVLDQALPPLPLHELPVLDLPLDEPHAEPEPGDTAFLLRLPDETTSQPAPAAADELVARVPGLPSATDLDLPSWPGALAPAATPPDDTAFELDLGGFEDAAPVAAPVDKPAVDLPPALAPEWPPELPANESERSLLPVAEVVESLELDLAELQAQFGAEPTPAPSASVEVASPAEPAPTAAEPLPQEPAGPALALDFDFGVEATEVASPAEPAPIAAEPLPQEPAGPALAWDFDFGVDATEVLGGPPLEGQTATVAPPPGDGSPTLSLPSPLPEPDAPEILGLDLDLGLDGPTADEAPLHAAAEAPDWSVAPLPASSPAQSPASAEPPDGPAGLALPDLALDAPASVQPPPEASFLTPTALQQPWPEPPVMPAGTPAPPVLPDTATSAHELQPVDAAAPDALPPEKSATPDPDQAAAAAAPPMLEEDEQVRVIGPLRIGIPLFNIFLNEADELSRRLGTELAEWALEHERHPVPDSSAALAHSLAGNSATVGYAELSALARALEHALLRSHRAGPGRAGEATLFNEAADEIRRLLHQFAAGFLRAVDPELMARLAAHERLPPTPLDAAAPTSWRMGAAPGSGPVPDAADIDPAQDIDRELFPIFEEEAEELLPQLQTRLREWLERPGEQGAPAACMRTLHTFKGGSRLAGAMRLGELAHRLETEVEQLAARDAVAAHEIEPLLTQADRMAAAFEWLQRRARGLPMPPAPQVAALPQAAETLASADDVDEQVVAAEAPAATVPLATAEPGALVEAGPAPDVRTPDTPDTPDETVVAPRAETSSDHRAVPPTAAVEPPPVPVQAALAPAAPEPVIDWSRFAGVAAALPAEADERAPSGGAAVRVRAGLLDRMVNQAGEVSITRARIDADMKLLQGSLVDLTDSLDRMRKQLRDIELQAETQISSRMEAAKAAAQTFDPLEMDRFTRFQELTRFMAESVNDVATLQRSLQRTLQSTEDELALQARLTRELQDDLLRTRMTEFDSLSDRLYRTVRQAARDTGKQARLEIRGGGIEIDRGVLERMTGAFEHLLRNCVAHGIEAPEARQAAGKAAVGQITVTVAQSGNEVAVEIADDGAGLDLPRIRSRAIERGWLALDTVAGDDEVAQLIFKPGFSTADAVTELAGRGVGLDVVRSEVNAMGGRIETSTVLGAGTRFRLLLPLTTAVTQVVMLRCGALQVAVPSTLVEIVRRVPTAEVEKGYAQGRIDYAGDELPFFWLASLLLHGTQGEPGSGRTQTVVVIRSAAQRVAVHVDEVVGNQEVVVKNVGPQLARLPGLAGVTLLPSGAVALIYNPVALANVYAERARALWGVGTVDVGAQTPLAPRAPLVMVVDDSLTVRRVTQRLLVREGYRVVTAKDGMDALERLAEERPVALLSDIEMPRMDGFDLLRNVRADPRLADLPVIMITSRTAQKHRDYAAELGADHYLGKPYAEEELLTLVARFAGTDIPS